MKRPARKLALFLMMLIAGGAIINLAVAWGCGARIKAMSASSPVALAPEELTTLWDEYGLAEFRSASENRILAGWRHCGPFTTTTWFGNNLPKYGVVNTGGASMDILIVESGFPCRCLRHDEKRGIYALLAALYGVSGDRTWLGECDVLSPGFAINTVFYAALLWGLFAAPFALRRSIRRRRGLCPACAYPVSASDICTECGKHIVKHKTQTQRAQTT